MPCEHLSTKLELTPAGPHYGKTVCCTCGKFMGWVKKPENIARDEETARRIVDLRKSAYLPTWEREFIDSIDGQGPKLSPKQREIIERIWSKYNQ